MKMEDRNIYQEFMDMVHDLDEQGLRDLIYDLCSNNLGEEDMKYYVIEEE